MSQAGVDDTLTLLESRKYSGVISPHGWMDPGNWPRLWKLGGMAFPGHSARRRLRRGVEAATGRGRRRTSSAGATAPTSAASRTSPTRTPTAAASPTRSRATTARSRSTARRPASGPSTTAKEGVAHYGLYADWFDDLRRARRRASSRTTCRTGAEAYLRDVGARRRRPRARLLRAAPRRSSAAAAARSASATTGRRSCAAPASRSSAAARGAGA